MTGQDSQHLIEGAKAGDPKAIDELIRRHIGALKVFVRARIDPGLRARGSSAQQRDMARGRGGKPARYSARYGASASRSWSTGTMCTAR